MEKYFVSSRKNTVNKNCSVRITKQNRLLLVSNCTSCIKKRLRFIKNQEESVLLSTLELKT